MLHCFVFFTLNILVLSIETNESHIDQNVECLCQCFDQRLHHDYELKPLKLGVEIVNFDLENALLMDNFDTFCRIKQDVYKHRLLVFRNQNNFSPESLVKLAGTLGHVFEKPFINRKGRISNHPKSPHDAIMRMSNDPNEGFLGIGVSGWHIDGVQYLEKPYSFIVFQIVKVPNIGPTRYTTSQIFQPILVKTSTVGTTYSTFSDQQLEFVHPFIYNHPVTEEKVLAIHVGFVKSFIVNYGQSNEYNTTLDVTVEIRRQLQEVMEKNDEEFVYSHEWKEGDVIIADNLAVAHEATKESQFSMNDVGLRVLHRVAINGEYKPTKKKIIVL